MYSGFIIHISNTNIVKIFSKELGLVSSFCKRNKKDNYKWQVGTYVNFIIEDRRKYTVFDIDVNFNFLSIIFTDVKYMNIFNSSITIINNILIKEQENKEIYKLFYNLMFSYNNSNIFLNYIDFLLNIVYYCGIYINFKSSAISGDTNVYYISPKTGNCVTKEEGKNYADKLFIIPKCFLYFNQDKEEIISAINILHYFIYKFCKDNYIEYKYKNIKFFKEQLIKTL